MKASEIAQRLAENAEQVGLYLLPSAKKMGRELEVGSISGEAGRSLKICISGDKAGRFKDFASDDGGDLLNLWALVRGISLSEAIIQAKEYLGIDDGHAKQNTPAPAKTFAVKAASSEQQRWLKYLTRARKLSPEVVEKYRVSGDDRQIVFPYYHDNHVINIKYLLIDRISEKKQIRSEKDAQPCLFGWQSLKNYHGSEITICEGEIDAMTLTQYGRPALSVPYGAGVGSKNQWIEFEFERLSRFEKIYLCFDQDNAGQEAANEIAKRLGMHRCFLVELPYKDANECLKAGVFEDDITECFGGAKTHDPKELRSAHLFLDQIIEKFYPSGGKEVGIEAPWEKAKGRVLFRPSELSIWTGINGHGKSQFLGQIMLGAMRQGEKVCVASLELKPDLLLKRMVQQASGMDRPSEDYIRTITAWYRDKLWVFDLTGTAKTERILEVFLYARQRYGITTFVIDSFLKCGIAEEDYASQKKFIDQLCDFKNSYDCHIHLVVHPRKGIDETKSPGKMDVKGTGSVTDLADNCFAIWRNKIKEKKIMENQETHVPDEILNQPDCMWICDKNRSGDWEGKFVFWFDKKSFQYLEQQNHRPVRYVEYSNVVKVEANNEPYFNMPNGEKQ